MCGLKRENNRKDLQLHPFFVCPQREPQFFFFPCSRNSTPSLSLCAHSAKQHSFFFSTLLALQPLLPLLVCLQRERPLFLLFYCSRFNPTLSFLYPQRERPLLFVFTGCRASNPFCVNTAQTTTISSFLLFSCFNSSHVFVCPQREPPPPFRLFYYSRFNPFLCVPQRKYPNFFHGLSRFNPIPFFV